MMIKIKLESFKVGTYKTIAVIDNHLCKKPVKPRRVFANLINIKN